MKLVSYSKLALKRSFDHIVSVPIDSLTPLMLLCKQEAYPSQVDDVVNMTKFLLEQGAVVNVRDKTGYTPFMYACTFGNKDIADLLLNLSAIDATDNFGKTVIIDHICITPCHFTFKISGIALCCRK